MDQYTSDAFASLVGQVFRFHRTAGAEDPSIDLELLEVQQLSPHRGGAAGRQPFSLLFALRGGDAPRQSRAIFGTIGSSRARGSSIASSCRGATRTRHTTKPSLDS
jgi:hypothetical protein